MWITSHSAPGQLLQEALPDPPSHSSLPSLPMPLLRPGLIMLQNWPEGCGLLLTELKEPKDSSQETCYL